MTDGDLRDQIARLEADIGKIDLRTVGTGAALRHDRTAI